MNLLCPLCSGDSTELYYQQRSKKLSRDFYQCGHCHLVFVDPAQRLNAQDEKAEYDLHNNDVDDAGYRQFLSRVQLPVQARIKPAAHGLDFGCGPGPALSVMMAEQGYSVSVYDIFYYQDKTVLDRRYDFITATEVVEHLFAPGEVLSQLWSLLEHGGILALMTKMVIDQQAFAQWHYKNDPTHIGFFSQPTFEWLAGQWGLN
ncbi:class I SAM-dependent methyltransferase [Oceanicoccus sagamiensis]|uniref:class I SAM-dependent methyltransferase n=1 Tax=Oceanicoccus sagamiensis TaxID=716816 RepID=UPI00197EBC93|nr:class I SAM-dependent methyltransferase [Oceanicoccus sagamiensis]